MLIAVGLDDVCTWITLNVRYDLKIKRVAKTKRSLSPRMVKCRVLRHEERCSA